MKELVVISGKGGTGKTSVTASFAALAKNAVLADCDVDAADLHLILEPDTKEVGEFKAGKIAVVDSDKCVSCGKCVTACSFHAIEQVGDKITIDPISCEGCSVCKIVCPVEAISMKEKLSGWWYISDTRYGPMAHAKLKAAEENSGKLVSLVREKAKFLAKERDADLVIIDGPPGIGCPVIASVGGVNAALIVTEPTMSGLHDLKRVSQLTGHFRISTYVAINKYDINQKVSAEIEKIAIQKGLKVVGRIPYDLEVTKALLEKKSIVEYSDGKVSQEIRNIWKRLLEEFNKEEK